MKKRWINFHQRIQFLNPIWQLGSGMKVGTLSRFAPMISFAILLEIFQREINANPDRTRGDIVDIAEEIIKEMGFTEEKEVIERLVDGLLWNGQKDLQQPFESVYFHELSRDILEHKYRFLMMDHEFSDLDKKKRIVYRLTEEGFRIILISREVQEELNINFQQMFIAQHIKNGNYSNALSGVEQLILHVQQLIKREKEYRFDIKRNPKLILTDKAKERQQQQKEIQKQFEEEQKQFKTLIRQLRQYQEVDEKTYIKVSELRERLDQSYNLHTELAKLVLSNINLELDLVYNHQELFWTLSDTSFRESWWENWIEREGMQDIEYLDSLLNPLFSPEPDFLYPLPWTWDEQDIIYTVAEKEEKVEGLDFDEELFPEIERYSWDDIVSLWEPVLGKLLQSGTFHIREIALEEEQEKWTRVPEALDLWMQFFNNTVRILDSIGDKESKEHHDERFRLIRHLQEKDPKFLGLNNTMITAELKGNEMIRWGKSCISPFQLTLKQR